MYRIAHISDLHLVAEGIRVEHTKLQKIVATLGASAGLKVEANPYSSQQLASLRIAMEELQPSAIFVTGDLTNYGDADSMIFAARVIKDLRTAAGAKAVYVTPGNHDTLAERMAAIEKDPTWRAWFVRRLRGVSPELAITAKLAGGLKPADAGAAPAFLSTFWRHIPTGIRPVDPRTPEFIDMGWGDMAVFLFNSNVDATFMANKGAIGSAAFVRLHAALKDRATSDRLAKALKIGLLHHHPISAPQAIDPDVERFFNWMDDGPKLLQYLNQQGFTLVLHGHQHQPFICTINYQSEDDRPLHIVAAGSATQAGGPASFNLIDILSPFEVRVQRFDYRDPQFTPDQPPHRLAVRSASSIRLTPKGQAEIPEDTAVRNLLIGSEYAYDSDIEYGLLDYRVTITDKQRYVADYRRQGTVRGRAGEAGTVFVITGSPPMAVGDMGLTATDARGNDANLEVLVDEGVRKVVRVSPKGRKLNIGDAFDITLHFEWQADETEPNDFDAFNFMNIRYPVGHFVYRVTYPWHAAKIAVREFVLDQQNATCKIEDDTTSVPGSTVLTVDFGKPRPVPYLICFCRSLRSWL